MKNTTRKYCFLLACSAYGATVGGLVGRLNLPWLVKAPVIAATVMAALELPYQLSERRRRQY